MLKLGSHTIILLLVFQSGLGFGQQLENGSFENWSTTNDTREPNGWNTIMTGDLCRFCSMVASQRAFADTKEVVEGRTSVRIESRSILGGIIFNGSITTGRIVVPGASASAGYNQTRRSESPFNQKLSSIPDSLVFWAKYNITDRSDSAIAVFYIHDEIDLIVPVSPSQSKKVVASIRKTFQTSGKWQRISIPFEKGNASANPKYIIATFSSSFAAGKGNGDAKLWVDAVELIYNNQELTANSEIEGR